MQKVLIVDDEENVLRSLARVLGEDYELYLAGSGSEGLDILRQEDSFAVLLVDYRMPQMDGAEFLSQAKEYTDAVAIMLTGYPEMATVEEAIAKGNVFLFLAKPCPADDLREAIDSAIEEYRRRQRTPWIKGLGLS